MFDWIETYGYPKNELLGKGIFRQTLGWFFIGIHEDEPACYVELYFNDDSKVSLVFDYFFSGAEIDLITPEDGIQCPQCEDNNTIVVRNNLFKHWEGKCRTCGKAWVIR